MFIWQLPCCPVNRGARVPDLVVSRLPSPYQFRARIQSFQGVAAPFAGDSVVTSASRAASATATPGSRDRRSARRQPPPRRRRRNRSRSRFLPHFVTFQGFARQKISPPVATRLFSSARSTFGHGGKRRLRPSRSRGSLASSHARAVARACRRDLNAVVGHAPAPVGLKGETGRFQILTLILFYRKKIRQKIESAEVGRAASRPGRKTRGKKERQVDCRFISA
jgi:hypothetical protein